MGKDAGQDRSTPIDTLSFSPEFHRVVDFDVLGGPLSSLGDFDFLKTVEESFCWLSVISVVVRTFEQCSPLLLRQQSGVVRHLEKIEAIANVSRRYPLAKGRCFEMFYHVRIRKHILYVFLPLPADGDDKNFKFFSSHFSLLALFTPDRVGALFGVRMFRWWIELAVAVRKLHVRLFDIA